MSPPTFTLSDASLDALHTGFDGAVISESSKRPNPEDPETSHVMKVRAVVYDISRRAYAILYKAASDRHELPGGARKKKNGRLEAPERAIRREVREELGIDGKQIISMLRLSTISETRERLGGLRIETLVYLVVVEDPEITAPKLSERELESEMETHWLDPFAALAAIAGQEHDSYTAAFDQACNVHAISRANETIAQGSLDRRAPPKAKKPRSKKKMNS
jgi:8-oxo-dGTP pyrophosphatase MutT (NUDIX family)